jgi:heme-degrading monooxygenase HmoA
MFVVIWKFEIAEDQVAGFEAAYGPEGPWAQLFRASSDYLGTELLRDAYIPGGYVTIDRWTSEEAFRAFRKEHDGDYEKLDRQCDALTGKEMRVGAYTSEPPT